MKEGLERDGKEASMGSFDLLEAFIFSGVIPRTKTVFCMKIITTNQMRL